MNTKEIDNRLREIMKDPPELGNVRPLPPIDNSPLVGIHSYWSGGKRKPFIGDRRVIKEKTKERLRLGLPL